LHKNIKWHVNKAVASGLIPILVTIQKAQPDLSVTLVNQYPADWRTVNPDQVCHRMDLNAL
jgi:hypothetical protein